MHRIPKIIKVKLSAADHLAVDLTGAVPADLAPLVTPVPMRHTTSAGDPKVIDYGVELDVAGVMTMTPAEGVGATAFETGDIITVLLNHGTPETLNSYDPAA